MDERSDCTEHCIASSVRQIRSPTRPSVFVTRSMCPFDRNVDSSNVLQYPVLYLAYISPFRPATTPFQVYVEYYSNKEYAYKPWRPSGQHYPTKARRCAAVHHLSVSQLCLLGREPPFVYSVGSLIYLWPLLWRDECFYPDVPT